MVCSACKVGSAAAERDVLLNENSAPKLLITHVGNVFVNEYKAFPTGVIRRPAGPKWSKLTIGDRIVFKESYWRRSYWVDGEIIRGMSVEDDVRYVADGPKPVASNPEDVFWELRECTKLPKFAWRLFGEVTGISKLAETRFGPALVDVSYRNISREEAHV
jgi:hypothetical protein